MTSSITCLLGAGYSYAAGAPLAKDLLRPKQLITMSDRSRQRFLAVQEHYETWQKAYPNESSEQYMGHVFKGEAGINPPKWEWLVEYICTSIASASTSLPSLNRSPRYSNRINRPLDCPIHSAFWKAVSTATRQISVITTNYDTFVERILRHRAMRRPPSAGCFYGGLPRPQVLKGAAQPFSRWAPERWIEMTGTIPVMKLHGSLNWTLLGESIIVFQDMRAVFRHGGTAAIVPPIPEKPVPRWLAEVWLEAEASLRRSESPSAKKVSGISRL